MREVVGEEGEGDESINREDLALSRVEKGGSNGRIDDEDDIGICRSSLAVSEPPETAQQQRELRDARFPGPCRIPATPSTTRTDSDSSFQSATASGVGLLPQEILTLEPS